MAEADSSFGGPTLSVVVDPAARERRRLDVTAAARLDDPLAGARCDDGTGELTALFFSREPPDIARAKRICATCPGLVPCLEGALERREPAGVWGGQLFLDGRILATKRPRGRPRKVPRPEDHIPDLPLPDHLAGVIVVRGAWWPVSRSSRRPTQTARHAPGSDSGADSA